MYIAPTHHSYLFVLPQIAIVIIFFFFFRNEYGVPIYERPPPKYSAYYIMKVLLDPNIDRSRVATERLITTSCNATFVVDLSKLQHPDGVKKDMFGRWEHSGSHPEVFKCSFNDRDTVTVEECAPGTSGSNVYYLRRLRSYCPTNHDVRRLMAFIHGRLPITSYIYSILNCTENL